MFRDDNSQAEELVDAELSTILHVGRHWLPTFGSPAKVVPVGNMTSTLASCEREMTPKFSAAIRHPQHILRPVIE